MSARLESCAGVSIIVKTVTFCSMPPAITAAARETCTPTSRSRRSPALCRATISTCMSASETREGRPVRAGSKSGQLIITTNVNADLLPGRWDGLMRGELDAILGTAADRHCLLGGQDSDDGLERCLAVSAGLCFINHSGARADCRSFV